MRPILLLPLLLLTLLTLTSCGNLQNLHHKHDAERRQKQLEKLSAAASSEASSRLGEHAVGEVAYVDAGGGYALVRARTGLALADGTQLECRGAGAGAKLRITPERKKSFVAADIISGTPHTGDPVVITKADAEKKGLRLVPIDAPAGLPGSQETVTLDPGSIDPGILPRSTLGEPANITPPKLEPPPDMSVPDGTDIMLEPPLPR